MTERYEAQQHTTPAGERVEKFSARYRDELLRTEAGTAAVDLIDRLSWAVYVMERMPCASCGVTPWSPIRRDCKRCQDANEAVTRDLGGRQPTLTT